MADDQYTYQEFAAVMRDLYPDLSLPDVPDDELTSAVVATHPAFKPHVVDPGGGMRGALATAEQLLAPPAAPPRRKNRDIQLDAQGPIDPRLGQVRTPARPPVPSTVIQPPPEKVWNSEAGMYIDAPRTTPLSALREAVVPGAKKAIRGAKAVLGIDQPPDQVPFLQEMEGAARGDPRSQALVHQPYARAPFTSGVSDILEGGMEAGMPLLPMAAAVAPVPTVLGLGVGMGAQYGTERGLEHLDTDPDLVRLGGLGAGLIAGAAAAAPPTLRGMTTAKAWTAKTARRVAGLRTAEPPPMPRVPTPTLDTLPVRQAEVGGPIRGLQKWDPARRPPAPAPAQKMLPPPQGVGPDTIIAGTPNDLMQFEARFTGPHAPTRMATSVPPEFPPEIETIGELVDSSVVNSRPQSRPTLVDPLTRGELRLTPPPAMNTLPAQGSLVGRRRGLGVNRMTMEGRTEQLPIMGGARDVPGQSRLPIEAQRYTPPHQRGHTPEEWQAFQQILDEMEAMPFQGATWDWDPATTKKTGRGGTKLGNAAGGNANMDPGHGGAKVFWDIVNDYWRDAPLTKRRYNPKTKVMEDVPTGDNYTPSRQVVEKGMRDYLEGRRSVWGERAMRVAKERLSRATAEGKDIYGRSFEELNAERLAAQAPDGEQLELQDAPDDLAPPGGPDDDLPPAFRDLEPDGLPEPGGWEPDESNFRRGGTGDEPQRLTVRGYRGAAPDQEGLPGRFFSADRTTAEAYGPVTEETLTFQRPLQTDNWMTAKEALGLDRSASMADLLTTAKKAGHDGLVFRQHNGRREFVDLRDQPDLLPDVRATENAPPEFDAPFSLEKPVSKAPGAVQETLFDTAPPSPGLTLKRARKPLEAMRDLFSDEEGSFTFAVASDDKVALKKWLHKERKRFGEEEWFQSAEDSYNKGNTFAAWRAISLASSQAGAVGAAAGTKAGKAGNWRDSPVVIKGPSVPPKLAGSRVTLGDGGVLRPPEVGLPKPAAQSVDDAIGNNFVKMAYDAVDPRHIGYMADGGPPSSRDLRIFSQMADDMLRTTDSVVLKELAKITGIKDHAELVGHWKRKISQAGKLLASVSTWRQENLGKMFPIYDIRGGSGEAPAALGAPPAGLQGLSKAQLAARVRKANAIKHLGESLDHVVKDGAWYDRRAASWAMTKAEPAARGEALPDAIENLSRAFIVSKSSTAIRNLWTQAGRYSVGIVDEVGAGLAAQLGGDRAASAKHFQMARELGRAAFRPGAGAKHPTASTLQSIYDFTEASLRGLSPQDIRHSLGALDKFPQHAAEYLGAMSGAEQTGAAPVAGAKTRSKLLDKLLDPRVRNQVTVMNRLQEFTTRSAVFDAALRTELTARGHNPAELYTKPFGELVAKVGTEEMDLAISTATHTALDFTFASSPYPGSVPSLLLGMFTKMPILSPILRMAYPFPRFNFVAAPRFIYDHSPMALFDLMRMPIDLATGNTPHKGRLFLGMTGRKIETSLLPSMGQAITEATIREGTALRAHLTNRVEAAKAARGLKVLERQMERVKTQAELPALEGRYRAKGEALQKLVSEGQAAKVAYLDAQKHTRQLSRERTELRTKLKRIQSIGAPSLPQYLSRQAAGATMFTAALLMRASDQAQGTDWYEYKANVPGLGERTMDLRPFAPFVQYLLPADVVLDVYHQTDWDKVHAEMEGLDHVDPQSWAEALGKGYHGKYTGERAGSEMVNAFLSISQAAGTTLSFIDLWQGKGTSQGMMADVKNAILGTIGQFLGRFTVPLQMVNEAQGQLEQAGGRYEAMQARIPEGPTAEDRATGDMLLGPTISNTPVLRETIPPTISPLSGQPLATVDPLARTLAGLTQRIRGRFDEELQTTGLPYYRAVPRRTGDRQFDNLVAKAYSEALSEHLTDILDDPDYVRAPTDLKRELLGSAMSSLRVAAYEKVARQIGDEATFEKLERPGDRRSRERWDEYLTTLETEAAAEAPPDPDAPPRVDPNAPPQP